MSTVNVSIDIREWALISRALATHKEHGGMFITRQELKRIKALDDKLFEAVKGKKHDKF